MPKLWVINQDFGRYYQKRGQPILRYVVESFVIAFRAFPICTVTVQRTKL